MGYTLELNIEKLVLDGFSHGDRYRISNSLQIELNRILSEKGIPGSLINSSEISSLGLNNIVIQPHQRAEVIGIRIAQSIYTGINNG